MTYREARPEDVTPQGIGLVEAGMKEVSLGQEPMCPARAVETMLWMIQDPNHLVAVSDNCGVLTGVIIGSVAPSMFSDSLFATMHVWYVRPEARGSWTGFRLARIYRDWARMAGAKTAYFDVNSGVDNERAGALAKKLGFRHIGDTYKAIL